MICRAMRWTLAEVRDLAPADYEAIVEWLADEARPYADGEI